MKILKDKGKAKAIKMRASKYNKLSLKEILLNIKKETQLELQT